MAALGYSGARVREEMVEILLRRTSRRGQRPAEQDAAGQAAQAGPEAQFTITIHLHSGTGE